MSVLVYDVCHACRTPVNAADKGLTHFVEGLAARNVMTRAAAPNVRAMPGGNGGSNSPKPGAGRISAPCGGSVTTCFGFLSPPGSFANEC